MAAGAEEEVIGMRDTALVDRYPEGARVEVFYDPDSPATGTLSTDLTGLYWRMAAFPVLLVLACGVRRA